MKTERIIKYGHPKENPENLAYYEELYCAMCFTVPMVDKWQGDRIVGTMIDRLYGLLIDIMTKEGPRPATMMVCRGCLARVDQKMRHEIGRRRDQGEWPFGPGGPLGGGGGIPQQRK